MSDQWNNNPGHQGGYPSSGGFPPGGNAPYGPGPAGPPQANQQGGYQQGGQQPGGHPQGGHLSGGHQQEGYQQGGHQQGGYQQGRYQQGGYQQGGYPAPGYGTPPRGNGRLIAIIAAVVVLIGAGIGSYFLFFKSDDAPAAAPPVPGGLPAGNPQNPGGIPQNPGVVTTVGPTSAADLAAQMATALQTLDLTAIPRLTCTADQSSLEITQQFEQAQQLIAAGIQLQVSVTSVDVDATSGTVSLTITVVDPSTGETDTDDVTENVWRNDLGRWMECNNALTAADQT